MSTIGIGVYLITIHLYITTDQFIHKDFIITTIHIPIHLGQIHNIMDLDQMGQEITVQDQEDINMATHYLTKDDILVHFCDHITKKELNKQSIGTSITLNNDQIVIIGDQRFSHLAKQNEN